MLILIFSENEKKLIRLQKKLETSLTSAITGDPNEEASKRTRLRSSIGLEPSGEKIIMGSSKGRVTDCSASSDDDGSKKIRKRKEEVKEGEEEEKEKEAAKVRRVRSKSLGPDDAPSDRTRRARSISRCSDDNKAKRSRSKGYEVAAPTNENRRRARSRGLDEPSIEPKAKRGRPLKNDDEKKMEEFVSTKLFFYMGVVA